MVIRRHDSGGPLRPLCGGGKGLPPRPRNVSTRVGFGDCIGMIIAGDLSGRRKRGAGDRRTMGGATFRNLLCHIWRIRNK